MRKAVTGVLAATLLVAGCATVRDSRLNPFNWFGRSVPVAVATETNPLIPARGAFARAEPVYQGRAIDQITDLVIEPLPGGAVVRATGVASRQGPYAVQLTPVESADPAVLIYTFDVILPRRETPVGPERTREVTVATNLSLRELDGVRVIRVNAARNARELRR